MKILITGTSKGIGKATALEFLKNGHSVVGLDVLPSSIEHPLYTHHVVDIFSSPLPEIENIEILINNAGVQNSGHDIDTNLKGTIRITEKYAFQDSIKSVLFVSSSSATTGSEFPEYASSKGGVISYMRNSAIRLSHYGATCNSISPGGVSTELNIPVMENKEKWDEIMSLTPLKKWATPEEIATWCYFLTVINKSATGEDILIDNGEYRLNSHFVWV